MPSLDEFDLDDAIAIDFSELNMTAVPIPTAVFLFGSGLMGMIGIARRKKA